MYKQTLGNKGTQHYRGGKDHISKQALKEENYIDDWTVATNIIMSTEL